MSFALLCLFSAVGLAQSPRQDVLTAESFWRKFYTYIPPVISPASARAKGLGADRAARAKPMAKYIRTGLHSQPPPDGWARPPWIC